MTRRRPHVWTLILSLGWGGCALNDRQGPNLPGESKTSGRSSDATVVVTVGSAADGRRLYARHCEDCHNEIAKSTRLGATTADILRGISRVPEMEDLDRLKISDLNSIAAALKK